MNAICMKIKENLEKGDINKNRLFGAYNVYFFSFNL